MLAACEPVLGSVVPGLLHNQAAPLWFVPQSVSSHTHYNVIDIKLVYVTPADSWFTPQASDRRHAESILELTYYRRDMHRSYIDDSEKQELLSEDALRRERGSRWVRTLPGQV